MDDTDYQKLLRQLNKKLPRNKKSKEELRRLLESVWHIGHAKGLEDARVIDENRKKWKQENSESLSEANS